MKKFSEKAVEIESVFALNTIQQAIFASPAYIGLDAHMDTIAVSVAIAGRNEPEFRGKSAKSRLEPIRPNGNKNR